QINGSNELYLYQNGQTIPLTPNTDWQMDFFFPDDFNSVVWGSWESDGIRFAAPRLDGGVEKATIDTAPFEGQLRRIINADSGKLYAAVEKKNEAQKSVLALYQVLPYDTTPKAEIPIPAGGWQELIKRTPFQISQGYLYYLDVHDPFDGFGPREVIRKHNLEDGSSELLLTSGRFELYGWKLSARTLFFAGFDYATSSSITGRINTDLAALGVEESEYLQIDYTDSAFSATNQINDIELLLAVDQESDSDDPLTITSGQSTDLRTSIELAFSQTMKRDTTQERIQLYSVGESEELISTLQVWFGKSLHLIPDLDVSGLFDSNGTTPLNEDSDYRLFLSSGIRDYGGNLYNSGLVKLINFTTDRAVDPQVPDGGISVQYNRTPPLSYDSALNLLEDSTYESSLVALSLTQSPLQYTIVTEPALGTVTLINSSTGAYRYTPNHNSYGDDLFTFKVNDGGNDSDIATVSITINPDNDAPTALDGAFSIAEDTSLTEQKLRASDVEDDDLTYTIVTLPTQGDLTLIDESGGLFSYTPHTNATGADSFTFQVNDGLILSNLATITLTLNSTNDAPLATDGILTLDEDSGATEGVLSANDIEGDALTFTIVTQPEKGVVTLLNEESGAYSYTPNTNTTGTDSFTFQAHDGSDSSNIASVQITIHPENDAPVAVDGGLTIDEDSSGSGTLIASDVEEDSLIYTLVTLPTQGTVTLAETDPSLFSYTPNENVIGTDSFTFKVNDGANDSKDAMVTITITPINDLPVALDGAFSIAEDTESIEQILGAGDLDDDALIYTVVTQPTKGTVEITDTTSGTYNYSPNANAEGTDGFTFKVNDGTADSNTATVTITLNATNDAPVSTNGTLTIDEDSGAASGVLSANDIDSEMLTYTIVTQPTKGILALVDENSGSYSYTPNSNSNGADSFTWQVSDGIDSSTIATVNITINAVNDAPVTSSGILTINEDGSGGGTLNAVDTEADSLIFTIITEPTKGTVTLSEEVAGEYSYAPDTNENGTDTFTFKANDSNSDSDVATVT
ncbi:MAG: tandem-95 repeat protein, partial [Gammaproteobacteria bacterium]|nr:tandem-95 repeat protein [Gammaproteobacteria bacterium]